MKEFDLELAKQKHPVQTRDGLHVRIICFDKKGKDFPIVALVESLLHEEKEVIKTYTNEGKLYLNDISDSDLVMAPVKKEGWINVYYYENWNNNEEKGEEIRFAGGVYKTKEKAQEAASESKKILATIKIEWEE